MTVATQFTRTSKLADPFDVAAENEARRIDTIEDARSVLASPRVSFVECMDCVAVARHEAAWELRRQAAERAFAEIDLDRRGAPDDLCHAAKIVISSFLRRARQLSSLPGPVDEARSWLDRSSPRFRHVGRDEFVPRVDERLAGLLILLSDATCDGLVRLSSALRKFEQAPLAIEAAQRALEHDQSHIRAMTTLGAALCDEADYRRAERQLRQALKLEPRDVPARTALSRVLQEAGRTAEAFVLARESFGLRPDRYSAHRLLAAAAELGDEAAINEALNAIDHLPDEEVDDVHLLLLAAEVALEAGDGARTSDCLRQLESLTLRGESARKVVRIRRRLRGEQRSLFDSQAGNND